MALFKRDKAVPVAPEIAGKAEKLAVFGERTPEQIQEALKAAAVAREEKKVLLDKIRDGHITLADLFSDAFAHDERAQRLLVGSVLRALPHVTPYRANKILAEAGIAHNRRIQGVGSKQQEKLLSLAK